jgi:cyclopropane-fatty-acyl-phospholipid synthase
LFDQLYPPPRAFGVRLWDGSELPAVARPAFSLILNHPGALRRMFSIPVELSLGEAFISGDFDIAGDIFSVFFLMAGIANRTFPKGEVLSLARTVLALPKPDRGRSAKRDPAHLSGARHSRERDRAAIQYHYDVGDDFYSLWLDKHMQYSCAYFPTSTEDLNAAQECKLEHICRKLRLKPGERLLDIGCGLGGLAIYAAEKYGVRVVGVTLSKNQAAYASEWIDRAGLGERVSARLQDYRDLESETFDKIVSVGMFEHVGVKHLPEYFTQAYRLLKPGGLFLNHGISRRPVVHAERNSVWESFIEPRIIGCGSFVQRYVFPDGELAPVSEVNLMAESVGFEVRDVENLREHYALTLRHWVNRLEARRAEALKESNEATYRTWRLYMSASAYGFESGNINVNQSLLSKPANGNSNLPLTRIDLYA